MYATIRRHLRDMAPPGERTKAGRALAARLGALPGFVAYVLLEQPDGMYIAVSIFEQQEGLAAADQLIGAWLTTCTNAPDDVRPDVTTGEVIVQRGL